MRNKAERRTQEQRAKKRASHIIRKNGWFAGNEQLDKVIGRMASVHSRPCSCPGCGNPRRHFGQKSIQELRADVGGGQGGF